MAKSWLFLWVALTGCTSTVDLDGAKGPNPYTYIPSQNSAYEVVVDERRVYWTTGQYRGGPLASLRSCLKSNCADTVSTFVQFPPGRGDSSLPLHLTLDSTGVYWEQVTDSYVRIVEKCGLDGCPSGPVTVATAPADSLAADGTEFYFSSSRDAAIYACSVDGCSTGRREVALHQGLISTLIVRGAYLYWPTGSVIWRQQKDGTGNPEALVNVSSLASLAVGDEYFYWSTYETAESASVFRCPVSGCSGPPEVVASKQTFPYKLAADARGVYWLSWEGEVTGCPVEACGEAPMLLASSQSFNNLSIALDADYVYWVTDGGSGGGGPFPFASIARAAR